MESEAHVSLPVAVTINDSSGDNSDMETTGSAGTSTAIEYACIELNIHALYIRVVLISKFWKTIREPV